MNSERFNKGINLKSPLQIFYYKSSKKRFIMNNKLNYISEDI